MMHATDRTLVQSLGIETDHKTPDHDLACLYLQLNAQKLAEKFINPGTTEEILFLSNTRNLDKMFEPHRICSRCSIWTYSNSFEGEDKEFLRFCNEHHIDETIVERSQISQIHVLNTILEQAVVKGTGQYQSHIGFIDLLLKVQLSHSSHHFAPSGSVSFYRKCERHSGVIQIPFEGRNGCQTKSERSIVIEVKTTHSPLGDAIRQMKLYRQHYQANTWIFATTVALDTDYKRAMENEDIKTLLISPAYKEVKKNQADMETI